MNEEGRRTSIYVKGSLSINLHKRGKEELCILPAAATWVTFVRKWWKGGLCMFKLYRKKKYYESTECIKKKLCVWNKTVDLMCF